MIIIKLIILINGNLIKYFSKPLNPLLFHWNLGKSIIKNNIINQKINFKRLQMVILPKFGQPVYLKTFEHHATQSHLINTHFILFNLYIFVRNSKKNWTIVVIKEIIQHLFCSSNLISHEKDSQSMNKQTLFRWYSISTNATVDTPT